MESIRTNVQASKLPALLLALALAFAAAVFALPQQAHAAEELNGKDGVTFTISDVAIINASGTPISLDQGSSTSDYAIGLGVSEVSQFQFSWSINTGTYVIQSGDTVTLPIQTPSLDFPSFTNQDLRASDGAVIGQIRKTGTQDGNLIITFNNQASTSSSWQGSFTSGNTLKRRGSVPADEVRTFTFNNTDHAYKIIGDELSKLASNKVRKNTNNRSATSETWVVTIGYDIERYLTDPSYESNRADPSWVDANLRHTDVYWEDTIAEDGIASVTISSIQIPINVPYSDTDPTACGRGTVSYSAMTSAFNRLTQNGSETKEEFKARVQSAPLQYGVYKDGDSYTVMVNLGNWPNTSLQYTDTNGRWDANAAVENTDNAFWSDARKELWKQTHAADNAIAGAVTQAAVYIRVNYKSHVVAPTQKSNTATVTMDGESFDSNTATDTLTPNAVVAHPAAGSAKLVKFSEGSNVALEGATFKIQRDDNGTWVDWHNNAGETSWTTNEDGEILIEGLGNYGSYRFVETAAASDEYNLYSAKYYSDAGTTEITGEAHFTIAEGDAEGTLIYCSNKKVEQQVEPETVDISGTKTWEHGTNPEADRPTSATILLLADGEEVDRATVTADDDWAYSFEGLPKYADDGATEIEYTIDEEAVEGYEKKVDGYDVTNTFKEPTTPPAPEEKKPLLSVKKTTGVTTAKAGDTIPYTITIANTGDGDATSVEVVDTMADGLEYVTDDANGVASGQTVTWTVDVAAGETKTIAVQCKVAESAAGSIVNSVLITPEDGTPVVPQKDADEATVTVTTPSADVPTGDDAEATTSSPAKPEGKTSAPASKAGAPSSAKKQTANTADANGAGTLATLLLALLASCASIVATRRRSAN